MFIFAALLKILFSTYMLFFSAAFCLLFLLILYKHQCPKDANKPHWPSSASLWAQEDQFSPLSPLLGTLGQTLAGSCQPTWHTDRYVVSHEINFRLTWYRSGSQRPVMKGSQSIAHPCEKLLWFVLAGTD